MAWLVVLIAVLAVTGVATWCGLALAEAVYGYPVGRDLVRRATGRLREHQFLPGDVQELDEVFSRVARSFIVGD